MIPLHLYSLLVAMWFEGTVPFHTSCEILIWTPVGSSFCHFLRPVEFCVSAHMMDLVNMPVCVLQLSTVTNLTIYGPNPCRGRAALCSFNVDGLHATDISTLLDQEGDRTHLRPAV